jgi:hypothetical protein
MADAPKDIHEALFALQSGGPIVLVKDQDGQVGNQKTKYADLIQAQEVIFGRLTPLDLLWVTAPTFRILPESTDKDGPKFVLDWELRHVPSKTKIEGVYPLPPGANPMQNGSAITYARRYALMAVTGAVAEKEDDDGGGYARAGMAQRANARQERHQPTTQPTAQRAAPAPTGERARPAQRPAVTPPQPPAQAGPHNGPDGPASDAMKRKFFAQLRQAGLSGDDGKALASDMTGREIASSNDITFGEMRGIIDAFEKALKEPDTAAATVIDIYRRTSAPTPTAEQAEIGHPPSKRTAAKKADPPVRRSTRESVTGTPDPNAGPAPWDDESPTDATWPEVTQPGQ